MCRVEVPTVKAEANPHRALGTIKKPTSEGRKSCGADGSRWMA